MAYTATTWTDGSTPVNASNMNKIESGLTSLDDAIENGGGIAAIQFDNSSSVLDQATELPNTRRMYFCFVLSNNVSTDITELPTSSGHFTMLIYKHSSDYIQILAWSMSSNGYLYKATKSSGSWDGWYRWSGAAV